MAKEIQDITVAISKTNTSTYTYYNSNKTIVWIQANIKSIPIRESACRSLSGKRGRKKNYTFREQVLLAVTSHLGEKEKKIVDFFHLFHKYFIRTCTQTRGDYTEFFLVRKKGFLGHAEYFLISFSEKIDYFWWEGPPPGLSTPHDRRHVP